MKKRILVCLLAALCITAMLASCTPSGEQDASPNEESASGALYYPGSSLGIVYAEEQVEAYLNDLYYDLAGNLSKPPVIRRDTESEIGQHELVIGKTNRPISIEAYNQLDRIEKQSDCDARYVIYSDGSSVAIAFENDKFDLELALDKSLEKFLSLVGDESTYYVKSGVIASALIDPIAYQEAIDNEMVAEKWQALREEIEKRVSTDGDTLRDKNGREVSASEYADGVVEELQKFYSQYSDNVISWFANLYEPAIDGDYKNGGGFYYSNSGRNTEGYLPDLESTSQALNFIAGSGMASPYGYALPDWMREQIARFVKGAQAPNGFFYHIQWGQEMTDKKLARRGRDRTNAENILRELGVSPTYDTPNLEGDGIVINNYWVQPASTPLTMRLSSSAAQAVSRVTVVAASSATPHLETKGALLNYLNNIIDIRNNCYGGGDELAAQGSEFVKRDKELKAAGADWSCSETVIEYLNNNVYESTGYWKSVVDYEGTNGLLKISALYNTLGAELPYPEQAAKSAIKTLTTSEDALTICFVYNAWYSIANITTNLRKYSSDTDAGAALADKISLDLLKNCQNEIAVSLSKNSAFKKDDGSYSYFTYGTVSDSHDMPVAVPQVDEGDVNATEIGIVGLTGNMFNALDLKGFMPPLYTESDWMRYLDILEGLNPVIKDDDNSEVEFITFDDEAVNEKTEYVDLEFNSSGSAIVVDDLRDGQSGNVLRVETVDHNSGDTLRFDCNSLRLSASCFVFEFDMFLESSDSGNILQVTLGNKAYMLMISVDDAGIHLCDISSGGTLRLMNDFGVTLPKNEWFNIKIEYYVGTEENVRIMVYANGELAGVTDNYYDSTSARLKGKVGTPVNMYTEASIFAMSYVDAVYYLDNVACYKTNAIYDEITDPDKQPNINIDAPRDEHVVSAEGLGKYFNDPEYADVTTRYTYDFMGYPSPNLTGPLYGKMFCADGMLIFERKGEKGTGETYVQYKLNAPTDLAQYSNYCSIYEFDYRVSEADLSYDNAPFRLDDGNYIRFVKNTDGTTWSLVEADTAEIKCGEWANIRFEIYYINEYTEIVKIYVDGEYATEVRLGEMSPFNSRLIMYMKKNVDKGTVINVDNMFIAHIDKAYVSEDGTTVSPGPNTNIGTAKGEGAYYNGTVTEDAQRWSFADNVTPGMSGSKGVKYIKNQDILMFIRVDNSDTNKEVYLNYGAPSLPSVNGIGYTVIEFDFYTNAMITGNYGISFRLDDSNYIYPVANGDGESYSIGVKDSAEMKVGQWYNVRFEIYYNSDATLVDVYVDGTKTTTLTISDTSAFTTRLLVYMKSAVTADTLIAMDNVFIGHFNKPLPEEPEVENPGASDEDYVPEAEVLAVKGGASGVVVIMHDDGDVESAKLLDSLYQKYGLRGSVALLVRNVMDVNTEAPYVSEVNSWKKLINTGRWNVTSHSLTHTWWGEDDSTGNITKEVVSSQTLLKNLFSTQRILTFAYPGFSSVLEEYGKEALYSAAKELVAEHYVAGRDYEGGVTSLNLSNWNYVSSRSMHDSWYEAAISDISSAANGNFAVIFMHEVVADGALTEGSQTTVSTMDKVCAAVAEQVESGKVWNAFFEEAALYLREAQGASVGINGDATGVTVTLTDKMEDNATYNYPLSVRVTLPASWAAAKVTQGDRTSYCTAYAVDGKWVVDADIVPDGGVATLVPVAVADIPEIEDSLSKEELLPGDTSDDDESNDSALGEGVYYNNSNLTGAILKEDFNSTTSAALPITNTYVGKSEIVNGANVFTNPDTENKYIGQSYLTISGQSTSGGNVTDYLTVIEFDMKLTYSADEIADKEICYRLLPFIINGGSGDKYFRFGKNADADTLYLYSQSVSTPASEANTILSDTWYNIRFEIVYLADGSATIDYYVNNVKIGESTSLGTTGAFINSIKVWRNAYTDYKNTAVMSIDNLFYGHLYDGTESGDEGTETEPTEPTVELGKGVYYNSTSSAKAYKQINFNTTGTLNGFDTPTTSYAVDTFATGTYVDGVATLERTASTWATAYFYYNIAESEFEGDITEATCKVFEFDYKISDMITGDGRNAFRLDGNDYVNFYKNSDGTTLSLGAKDSMTITPGEWCNIRFEFYNVDGVKYMQIYINNAYAYTQTLADTANTFNNRIYFYLESATSVGTTVCVDNLVIAYVDKAYEAN